MIFQKCNDEKSFPVLVRSKRKIDPNFEWIKNLRKRATNSEFHEFSSTLRRLADDLWLKSFYIMKKRQEGTKNDVFLDETRPENEWVVGGHRSWNGTKIRQRIARGTAHAAVTTNTFPIRRTHRWKYKDRGERKRDVARDIVTPQTTIKIREWNRKSAEREKEKERSNLLRLSLSRAPKTPSITLNNHRATTSASSHISAPRASERR